MGDVNSFKFFCFTLIYSQPSARYASFYRVSKTRASTLDKEA